MLDPLNPEQALTASALYMAAKLQAFGGDYAKALAAYNAGSGGVQRAIAEATRVEGNPDAWRNYLPNETQRYIQIILG
jgi:soluble lytic murein transglycosylase-like protein